MKKTIFLLLNLMFGVAFAQDFSVMPYPQKLEKQQGFFEIEKNFSLKIEGNPDMRLYKNSTSFLRNLANMTGVFIDQGYSYPTDDINAPKLLIKIERPGKNLIYEDESYSLQVSNEKILIIAKTDLGAIHALQTLLQLVTVQDGKYVFPNVNIEDFPRFTWRGLMIDASRHFIPVDVLKRNLDAMSFVKMNVFHWHLSDDQGFRVEVNSLPNLHKLASDGDYYTQAQIKDVVTYAGERGIRVIPEFDVPPHATSILTAYPELGSKDTVYALERNAGIFDPTLDPSNEKVYDFLDTLFKEITPLFPDEYVHIGGDENAGNHWNESKKISEFKKKHDLLSNHDLQTYFNLKVDKILAKYNKKLMGWDEILTPNMSKSALIHSWRGVNEGLKPKQTLIDAVKNGHFAILSNGYYIDLMLSVEDHYLDPMPEIELSASEKKRILGGEAAMWSELVTPITVDSRIWPRTAAIAEKLWSAAEINDLDFMWARYDKISNDLEKIGIQHKRNKSVILRNIVNYQETDALDRLSKISEPYKIYSRNSGGTEYKMYSPLTLFADACTADAEDKRTFDEHVSKFIKSEGKTSKDFLIQSFDRYARIYTDLETISSNAPLLNSVLPYVKRVEEISNLMKKSLQDNRMSASDFEKLNNLLEQKEAPKLNLDVEFALTRSTKMLADYLHKS